MVADGLWDVYNDFHMGNTAELVAREFGVTRAEQDEFAAQTHRKAAAAQAAGKFEKEIVPVDLPQKKGAAARRSGGRGHPRRRDARTRSAKLKPAFAEDGTVTAGNASQITDGAAAVVVMERGARAARSA